MVVFSYAINPSGGELWLGLEEHRWARRLVLSIVRLKQPVIAQGTRYLFPQRVGHSWYQLSSVRRRNPQPLLPIQELGNARTAPTFRHPLNAAFTWLDGN